MQRDGVFAGRVQRHLGGGQAVDVADAGPLLSADAALEHRARDAVGGDQAIFG